ncbi:hypothetical protein BPT24_284 [Tenacibaculum phage pT24]|uniref:Uncharacterized protein n=1 Tax=Tenacibaculum phage pT24 TaxID=1880590 RepID=A0A1B4XX67_9CAUD|nr:hypothetical protein HYP10_gp244 [Tenacibaculum phage pT24]BAV39401.1 hypothetical protein BPT24_284 [Tenacibaculum phage pT24]
MYIFALTKRGDRTNIKSNFRIVDLDEVVKIINSSSSNYNSIRFAKLNGTTYTMLYHENGTVENINKMGMIDFEHIFVPKGFCLLSKDKVDMHFKKEISDKYGTENVEEKPVKLKDVEVGKIYKNNRLGHCVYAGEYALFKGRNMDELKKQGHCFISVTYNERTGKFNSFDTWDENKFNITKSFPKVFESDKGFIRFIPKEFESVSHSYRKWKVKKVE